MRDAAVDLASTLLRPGRPRNPRVRRVVIRLLIAWATAVACLLVYLAVVGRAEDVNWASAVGWSALAAWLVLRRRSIRRSLELNAGAPEHSQDAP